MPRKQKQKQRQVQRQVVNINLGKSTGKPKRKYNRKTPSVIVQQPNYTFTAQPYQLTPQVFIPPQTAYNPIMNQQINNPKTNPLLSQTSIDPIRFESSVSNEKALKSQKTQLDELSINKPSRLISNRDKYIEPSIVEPPKIPKRNIGPLISDPQSKPKPSPISFDMPKPREPKQSSQLDNLDIPFMESPSVEERQIPSLDKLRNAPGKRKPKKPERNPESEDFARIENKPPMDSAMIPPYVMTNERDYMPLYLTNPNQLIQYPKPAGLPEALQEQRQKLKPVNYNETPMYNEPMSTTSVYEEMNRPMPGRPVTFKKKRGTRGPYKKTQKPKI